MLLMNFHKYPVSMFSMSYISIDAGFPHRVPRMRRRTPGVDALREEALAFWWSGRIRPEEKKKNGTDRTGWQKKYIEGNCVQVEMSLKGFCFKNLQIINFSNKSRFRKAPSSVF